MTDGDAPIADRMAHFAHIHCVRPRHNLDAQLPVHPLKPYESRVAPNRVHRDVPMIDIGRKISLPRTSVFTQGPLTLSDFSHYNHHWLALCGLSALESPEATILDRHKDHFWRDGALLLAMCPDVPTFHAPWIRQTPTLRTPVLADPLSRLHRLFTLFEQSAQFRCCSVLIDPSGVLRARLTHHLSDHGMILLKDASIVNQRLTQQTSVSSRKGAFTPCIR